MADEKKATDLKELEKIISMMVENDLVEVEIIKGEDKIYFRRPEPAQVNAVAMPTAPMAPAAAVAAPASVPAASAPAEQAPAGGGDNLVEIKSPIVGTFYAAPSPDSDPYVKVGSKVDADTVVCIVEAMKVMNEIKAEVSGTIAEIKVQNGEALEYGQVIFKVKP